MSRPDPKPFTFRVQGHGHDIPAGTYEAETEDKAFKLALKAAKCFDLPGWKLVCTDTGTVQNVAEFIDPAQGMKVRQ